MTLTPIIPAKSLAEVAATKIRDAILSGHFRLGENISEDRLVDMLGVSRTPVRDAMALLAREGLVVVRPKRGSFVFETSPEDIKAIAPDILRHRVIPTYEAEAEEVTADDLVARILDAVEVP